MSERIIQALLKLFAVFAKTDGNKTDKIKIVELFLAAQLNKELAKKFLPTFEQEYDEVMADISRITEKASAKGDVDTEKLKFKIEAKLSARIHKIGNSINQELTQRQKLYVVISLLEFVSTDNQISSSDKEFLDALVEDLNIDSEEYNQLCEFILHTFEEIPDSENLLVINNQREAGEGLAKHLCSPHLQGSIKVSYLRASNLLIFRCSPEVGEITLNSQPVYEDKVTILNIGSAIRSLQITPIYYSQILNVFNSDNSQEGVVFRVDDITYKFKGGNIGLHEFSMEEASGSLVGIMGASGAGKSTLLNVLNGNYTPTTGKVTINDIDLHHDTENKLNGLIGFVPQDDLLIKELTVYENLFYSAKLCFDNLTDEEIAERADKVLQSLGLYERKDNVVGDELKKEISGGQRKRLNIALELIREPAILFLDEPTSGLSSKDSENIMDLLKELALKGKLVFVVIHQPSSDIFKTFDRLVILDTGGYQIYYGAPVDSIMYFKECTHLADWFVSECPTCGNVNPEQIFNITEAKILNEDGTPMLNEKRQEIRKLAPTDWFEIYQQKKKTPERKPIPKELPEITFKIPNWIRQLKVFIVRDMLSKVSNMQYMLINALESPIIAVFLAFIIKYWNVDENGSVGYNLMNNANIPVYIFMLVICGFFIGLSSSAEEIFRDQKIRSRESFLHLSWSSYLVSKIIILLGISAIQSFLFVILGNWILEIHGLLFKYWFMAFTVWSFANMTGLIISDSFNDIKTIYILIPFLVIPQIILSGIIVSFDKLNPSISNPQDIPFYGEIIASRWAYEGLAVEQYSSNEYEAPFFELDMKISECSYRKGEWSNQLNNRLNDCIRYVEEGTNAETVAKNVTLVSNEIQKELKKSGNEISIAPGVLEALSAQNVTKETLQKAQEYVQQVKQYYIKQNNKYRSQKDKLTYNIIKNLGKEACEKANITDATPHVVDSIGNALFLDIKKKYYNEALEDFCKNTNDLTVLIEYKGNLVQKTDPIFIQPTSKCLRAHFYAPMKPFFGNYVSTYWANAIIIWIMSILCYLVLYFRLLRKGIEYLGNINFSKK
ncbi:MAG: ATP-binding cassette domain-containing protein [Bacteroidales bacterium]|nr:ATP-binding cassette domain-containing protein [Bacteroidales bacterium]